MCVQFCLDAEKAEESGTGKGTGSFMGNELYRTFGSKKMRVLWHLRYIDALVH